MVGSSQTDLPSVTDPRTWESTHRILSPIRPHGLDPEHCTEAGIYPLESVEIWNKHSGARLSTYVIYGEPGSRCCILNGAAARTCQVGDEVIIAASSFVQPQELYTLGPRVLTFRPDNSVDQMLSSHVFEGPARHFAFPVLEHGPDLWLPAELGRPPEPFGAVRIMAAPQGPQMVRQV